MYKAITGTIKELPPSHLLQVDQRGGRVDTKGCIDNQLTDKTVAEDAKINPKNLSMVWIDIKKAFDSVSHEWIIKVLQMYEAHPNMRSLIEKIINSWTITLEIVTAQGKERIGPIKVNRGIMQGDDFSVLLYAISVDPISWAIRTSEGYRLTHEKNDKVTHLLFVDDLKCYTRSEQKLVTGTRTLSNMFDDIGLCINLGKCVACHIKRGKYYKDADLPIGDD